ncbi:uncharacterized protein G2W53_044547 [Senna tora]|uniref:Uncharacterized protein n=1 Tax=Senna tora TaxID=362788 RepID=A0A834VX18_9FABA|nr:uncharacterized protein G2W53_044547 [Senna tora]
MGSRASHGCEWEGGRWVRWRKKGVGVEADDEGCGTEGGERNGV